MFHTGTQTLIDAWASLPEAHRIPTRSAVDPSAFPTLVPQIFMAERLDTGIWIRMAGAWVERLHGQPLKGVHWLEMWRRESRLLVHQSAGRATREARPVVIKAEIGNTSEPLEVTLCPLRGPNGVADRLLGLYQPLTLAGTSAEDIAELIARLAVDAEVGGGRPALSLAAIDGRRIA